MLCTICHKAIILRPSAAERAKRCGGRPSDYTRLFTEHSDCAIAKRAASSKALMAKLATPFIVEGVDTEDGSRTELASFANSGEARAFLNRYTSREDVGGWSLIEVYDTRGEEAERLWYWEREDV